MTYVDLLTDFTAWIKRDLSANFQSFVRSVEDDLAKKRLRCMAKVRTDSDVPLSDPMPLPADFLEVKSLTLYSGGRDMPLAYQPPELFVPCTGAWTPKHFTIDASQIWFSPHPDASYSYRLRYYAPLPSIITAAENWVLDNAWNIYLFGTLTKAAIFTRDAGALQTFGPLYQSAMDELVATDAAASIGGAPRITVA